MDSGHVPVLINEIIEAFLPLKGRADLTYFDGTFGRGGHLQQISKLIQPEKLIASDQDLDAVVYAKENFPEVDIHHKNFADFALTNKLKLDAVLLDLGVSSPQLDNASRGFSFNKDGPLDMRMNQKYLISAREIIQTYSEDDLIQIFKVYGEVEKPQRVVRAICSDRIRKSFDTTMQLSGLIERVDGWKKKGFHPATQYFMALRLVVNKELQVVEDSIPLFIEQLKDGGRIAVITFHSLEDRIVKNIFKNSGLGHVVNKKVIVPSEEECKINPRARSAKLRIFQKGEAPLKPDKFAIRRSLRDQK